MSTASQLGELHLIANVTVPCSALRNEEKEGLRLETRFFNAGTSLKNQTGETDPSHQTRN